MLGIFSCGLSKNELLFLALSSCRSTSIANQQTRSVRGSSTQVCGLTPHKSNPFPMVL